MLKMYGRVGVAFAVVSSLVLCAEEESPALQTPSIAKILSAIPSFEPNNGQYDSDVKFYGRAARASVLLSQDEIAINIGPDQSSAGANVDDARPNALIGKKLTLRIEFEGASKNSKLVGEDQQSDGTHNAIPAREIANAGKDDARVPRVVYRNLYPGIDLQCQIGKHGLQRTLILKEGANLKKVRFTYAGVDRVRLSEDGQLELTTEIGVITESPVVVVMADGKDKTPRMASFTIEGRKTVGVEVARGN